MAFKIKLSTKQRRKNWQKFLNRQHPGGPMVRDTDKPDKPQDAAEVGRQTLNVMFMCPADYVPVTFIVTALDKDGKPFTNAPTDDPAVTLILATKCALFASQLAIQKMNRDDKAKSPIVTVPGGSIPPWIGPEGRG